MREWRYQADKVIGSVAGTSVAMIDPRELHQLAPVLAALARGTARSKLRTLDVVCRHNVRLAEIFGTGGQAVVLARGRRAGLPDGWGVVPLADLDPHGPLSPSETTRAGQGTVLPVVVQNRCCTVPLWGNELVKYLQEKRKRVVMERSKPTSREW